MPLSDEYRAHLNAERLRIASLRAVHEKTVTAGKQSRMLLEDEIRAVDREIRSLNDRKDVLVHSLREVNTKVSQELYALRDVSQMAQDLECRFLRIQDFPLDILRLVFEVSVEDMDRMKWTLSAVSREWRRIALSTPSLWSCYRCVSNKPATLEVVRHQRQLNGSYPLAVKVSLRLYGRYADAPRKAAEATTFVKDLFSSDRTRWKTLYLSITVEDNANFSKFRGPVRALEYGDLLGLVTLEVRLSEKHCGSSVFAFNDVGRATAVLISGASNLRSLELRGGALPPELVEVVPVSLRYLRLVDVRERSGADVLILIERLPCLHSFELVGIIWHKAKRT